MNFGERSSKNEFSQLSTDQLETNQNSISQSITDKLQSVNNTNSPLLTDEFYEYTLSIS